LLPPLVVTPAEAGVEAAAARTYRVDKALPRLEKSELADPWVPAFAGMTRRKAVVHIPISAFFTTVLAG